MDLIWLIVAGVIVFAAGFWLFLPSTVFNLYTRYKRFPNRRDPSAFGLSFDNLTFTSRGLTHHAWFIFPKGQENEKNLPTIIMPHGYAANREQIIDRCCHLAQEGLAVFTFDWRRCGESQGDRISLGLLEIKDLHCAIDYLKTLGQVDSRKLAIYGFSMGAAVSVIVASERQDIRCLVADSPFASIEEITSYTLKQMFIPPFLVLERLKSLFEKNFQREMDEFNCLAVVDKIAPRPVLFLGNRKDRMVPFTQIEQVFLAAAEPKQFYVNDNGGHFANAEAVILDQQVIPFLKSSLELD